LIGGVYLARAFALWGRLPGRGARLFCKVACLVGVFVWQGCLLDRGICLPGYLLAGGVCLCIGCRNVGVCPCAWVLWCMWESWDVTVVYNCINRVCLTDFYMEKSQ
jgi:hypothetical protein